MFSESDFTLPQGTLMTSHFTAEPMETDLPSPSAGQIVLSETSPASGTSELPLSEGSQSDCDSDYDDLLASPSSLYPLSWSTAAGDALEGIHYVRERFPSDNTSYLAPQFRKEPLSVEEGDTVIILEEVSEFIIRVRHLRTNSIGVLPVWNVEGALERLARQNMELNEIVTCPAEVARQPGSVHPSSSPVSHEHEHCSAELKRRMIVRRGSMDEDADFPLTPTSPVPTFPQKLSSSTRKVGFSENAKRKIFRYIPPSDEEDQWENDSDEADDGEESESSDEGDAQWWWDGWEESHSDDEDLAADEHAGEEDGGYNAASVRLLIRRQNGFSVTL